MHFASQLMKALHDEELRLGAHAQLGAFVAVGSLVDRAALERDHESLAVDQGSQDVVRELAPLLEPGIALELVVAGLECIDSLFSHLSLAVVQLPIAGRPAPQ